MIREQLLLAIATSVEVVVQDHADGARIVRGLDATSVNKIADAVLLFVGNPPLDDTCRNYSLGAYSRGNLAAFVSDVR